MIKYKKYFGAERVYFMKQTSDIKVIFLDIDNTILDFDAAAEESMKECFRRAGLVYKPEMLSVFHEVNHKVWQRIEKGELTMDDLFYVRWQPVLKQLGLEADGVEMEKNFRILLKYSAVPVKGAYDILEYLFRKYRLCAASNGPYDQQITRLQKADMLKSFEHCFVSEKIGADKPGKDFFDGCFAQLPGILPEETMIIGDSLTADIAGGKVYGLKTCWFDKNKQQTELKSDEKPDYIVTDLSEIKEIC